MAQRNLGHPSHPFCPYGRIDPYVNYETGKPVQEIRISVVRPLKECHPHFVCPGRTSISGLQEATQSPALHGQYADYTTKGLLQRQTGKGGLPIGRIRRRVSERSDQACAAGGEECSMRCRRPPLKPGRTPSGMPSFGGVSLVCQGRQASPQDPVSTWGALILCFLSVYFARLGKINRKETPHNIYH